MGLRFDDDGQPANRSLNAARLSDRALDELIGACRGVLADGAVTKGEALFLLDWMNANREAASHWPADALYRRLHEMLVDRTLDVQEQGELLELLHQLVGGPVSLETRVASISSSLPLCKPSPIIVFEGSQFCLTGKFATGTRQRCEAMVVERGGITQSAPTQTTSFLVIGVMGSADWIHSTHGRKIEAAVQLKAQGHPIRIVSEAHWVRYLEVAR